MLALLLALPAGASATRVRRGPTSPRVSHHSKAKGKKKNTLAGQRQIDPQRATEIQTALLKAGYLHGEPSGEWDGQSAAAMQKFQADNGWQTKYTPDARALIKLGLGPKNTTTASLFTPSSGQN